MDWAFAILGLGLLMVVHEGGHHLVARAFGMRVIKFSIGFGPALWRHQPRGSDTIYQIALIPFLAYVQIAGMNPLEEIDTDDKASYANASLPARISTIFAGPLANYLFASVLFFGAFMIGGEEELTTRVQVLDGPAKQAQVKDGDRVVSIDGKPIQSWDQLRKIVHDNPGKKLSVQLERGGKKLVVQVKPQKKGDGGVIGVQSLPKLVPMSVKDASIRSVVLPALVVKNLVVGLARIATGKEKAELTGPVGIVKETRKAMERGLPYYLSLLGIISAYLGGFNLLPIPALDGGRLMFLGYEAVTRRRANARVEAQIHAAGLVLLLMLILVVSFYDLRGR